MRFLIVVLAVLVSPVSVAVCEMVCGLSMQTAQTASSTAQTPAATPDVHAHHGHHATPAQTPEPAVTLARAAGADAPVVSIPAADCDLRTTVPARVRSNGPDVSADASASSQMIRLAQPSVSLGRLVSAVQARPPVPPLHAPVPLRI